MSRTPKYNVGRLPLWVQKIIDDLKEQLADVLEQLDEAQAQVLLRDEEIAALEANAERIAIQAEQSDFRVDL